MGKTFKDSPVFKFDKVKQARKYKKQERKFKLDLNRDVAEILVGGMEHLLRK